MTAPQVVYTRRPSRRSGRAQPLKCSVCGREITVGQHYVIEYTATAAEPRHVGCNVRGQEGA